MYILHLLDGEESMNGFCMLSAVPTDIVAPACIGVYVIISIIYLPLLIPVYFSFRLLFNGPLLC